MDFDKLLELFFGTSEMDTLTADQILAGVEQLREAFGREPDKERRFGMWCLLYMLGAAPDVSVFEDEAERDAAHDFMDMADEEDDDAG